MKTLERLALVSAVIGFAVLGVGIEHLEGMSIFIAIIIFLALVSFSLYLFSRSIDNSLKSKIEPKEVLECTIIYQSVLLGTTQKKTSCDQIEIHKILERLTKSNIKYDIDAQIKRC